MLLAPFQLDTTEAARLRWLGFGRFVGPRVGFPQSQDTVFSDLSCPFFPLISLGLSGEISRQELRPGLSTVEVGGHNSRGQFHDPFSWRLLPVDCVVRRTVEHPGSR